MTTNNTTQISRIKELLSDGDTAKDVFNKIIANYPEILEKRLKQVSTEKQAMQQLNAQISSVLYRHEGILFDIDRSTRPYRYSFISTKESDDIDEDINDSDISIDIEEQDIGYIYIIDTNLYTKDGESIYKIGKANDIDKRIKQLNSEQGCYEKHTIKHTYRVIRPYKIEHSIHCLLDKGRVNPKKEGFYGVYVEENIELIESMVKLFEL